MLLKEFEAIDSRNSDGYIQKEELEAFVKSCKICTISDSDLASLWSAMDIDNDQIREFIGVDYTWRRDDQCVQTFQPGLALVSALSSYFCVCCN